jgi:hypothetical protein
MLGSAEFEEFWWNGRENMEEAHEDVGASPEDLADIGHCLH